MAEPYRIPHCFHLRFSKHPPFLLTPPTNWQRKREGKKTRMLCVCLWSEISYNPLTTRPGRPSVNNVTSINTVFKQGRFYPLNPLQKGDEAGALLKGPAQRRIKAAGEGGPGHWTSACNPGCDTALPSWDTAPGGCVIASSLPQGTQHTRIVYLPVAPIAEFARQCHSLSPDHLPSLHAMVFSS